MPYCVCQASFKFWYILKYLCHICVNFNLENEIFIFLPTQCNRMSLFPIINWQLENDLTCVDFHIFNKRTVLPRTSLTWNVCISRACLGMCGKYDVNRRVTAPDCTSAQLNELTFFLKVPISWYFATFKKMPLGNMSSKQNRFVWSVEANPLQTCIWRCGGTRQPAGVFSKRHWIKSGYNYLKRIAFVTRCVGFFSVCLVGCAWMVRSPLVLDVCHCQPIITDLFRPLWLSDRS